MEEIGSEGRAGSGQELAQAADEEPIPSTPPQPILDTDPSGDALEEDGVETLDSLVHDMDLEAYLDEEDPLGMAVYRAMCQEPMSCQVSHNS